jgi:hypothetical protein
MSPGLSFIFVFTLAIGADIKVYVER